MASEFDLKYFLSVTLIQKYNKIQLKPIWDSFLLLYFIPINFKIKTMEVRVRKRGTDIEKIVPIKVYESLKHVYIKISDVDGSSTDEDVKKKQEQNASAQPAVVEFEKPVVVTDGVVKTLEISTDSETSEVATNDAAEYQKLTGRKPDGRWSPEKLSAKIQELKTNTNEG